MGNSLTYNGYDLSAPVYGLVVSRHPWPILADIHLDVQAVGGGDGAVTNGTRLKPKYATLECVVSAADRGALQTQLEAIAAVLDSRGGTRALRVDAWPERRCMARLNGPIIIQPNGWNGASLQLNFIIPSGHMTGFTEVTQSVTIDETPESFNVTASGAVAGTATALPTWTVTNTDAATVTSVALSNTTRDETVTWTGSLVQDALLRFDSERHFIEKSTDGGTTWASAMTGRSSGSVFPQLTAGTQNACTIRGVAGGALNIAYYARYL